MHPWQRPGHRHWGDEGRQWRRGWHPQGRALFLRLTMAFGFVVLLLVGGIGVLAFLVTRLFGGDGQTAAFVWIAGLGLVFVLPALGVVLAVRAFGRIAAPLADVMAAADSVAAGDLSVRVRERRRGAFDRLAGSFNRMVDELERTEQLRKNLTADVAHELRTPLQVVQGNLEGIVDGVYEPTSEHINSTLEETRLLARLVDDLGTLSLAESGQLPLVLEPLDVDDLLTDVAGAFASNAEAAGVTITVSRSPEPLTVRADAMRMQQVLGNLVANAIRNTPPQGEIRLSAASAEDGARIELADTGAGIAPEDLPFIFERFWKRETLGQPSSGSGLGLAIAHRFVEAHGGRIEVSSEPGAGTTFAIWLPSSGTRPTDVPS